MSGLAAQPVWRSCGLLEEKPMVNLEGSPRPRGELMISRAQGDPSHAGRLVEVLGPTVETDQRVLIGLQAGK